MFSPPLMTALTGGASVPELTTRVALPLTYDLVDYNTLLTWTTQGGKRVTPEGFLGDGFEARMRATTLPTWLDTSTDVLTLHASIKPMYEARNATADRVVTIGNNDATANPKLELCIVDDGLAPTEPTVVARCYNGALQAKRLARSKWRYRFRAPELSFSAQPARPQGVLHISGNRVLIAVHFNDTLSRCYMLDSSTGTLLGQFDFAAGNHHVAAIAYRASDGTYWFGDYATGDILRVDLEASLASGTAVVTLTFTLSADNVLSGIEWATISGNERLLFAEYLTSGTPYIYVVNPTDVVNGNTFNTANRIKRMVCTLRLQGITYQSGVLYVSSNRITGDVTPQGNIQLLDFATFMASGADGDDFTLYDQSTWLGPSEYPEDVSIGPDGELWTCTEGYDSVGSDNGWLAWWSTPFVDVENHYTLEFNGSSSTRIKINDRFFEDIAWVPTINPAAVSVGGPPQAAAGQTNGFFLGTVRNIVIQDTPLSHRGYSSAVAGRYEPNALTVFTITITNPGAEAGNTTGWTNETNSIDVRSTNPLPHSGSFYFRGGAFASSRARQRFGLVAAGLTTGQLDAGTCHAIVKWWQAGFTAPDADTISMGIRYLDGTPTQISQNIPTLQDMTPDMTWIPRSYGLLIPTLTRNLDLIIDAVRASGTNHDSYIDDIELKVYAP
jgi:hypothetical protein